MNIEEPYRLAEWFNEYHRQLVKLYNGLLGPLQHNATQPNKQPIEDQLAELESFVGSISFEELSLQQISVLTSHGLDRYIGPQGAEFIRTTIRTSDYDPATAVQRTTEAIETINRVQSILQAYQKSVDALDPEGEAIEDETSGDRITIRVGFQDEAAIRNVSDWRDAGKDWYEIIRGLALAAGESPEDTKVIGASSGSIIVILAGTATVTTLLAVISKNVCGVARNIIDVRAETENLRQKKILTRAMENELKKVEKKHSDSALTTIMAELKGKFKLKDGEVVNALENSISKLLTFAEKGGNVDFVAPEGPDDAEGSGDDGSKTQTALAEARDAIHEFQGEREALKLLTDGSPSNLAND